MYSISKSKIIKSSYFWFLFVPLAAKLIEKANNNVFIKRIFKGDIDLPFSWENFFFGATFLAIANLIFLVRCPKIIKNYKYFSEFEKMGLTASQLIEIYGEQIASEMKKESRSSLLSNLRTFYAEYCQSNSKLDDEFNKTEPRAFIILSSLTVEDKNLAGAFWHVRTMAHDMHKCASRLCGLFYAIGLLFIAWVFYENFKSVLEVSAIYETFDAISAYWQSNR